MKTCKGRCPTGFELNFKRLNSVSGVFNLNKVLHYANHTLNVGVGFVLHRLVHFTKAQRGERRLLSFAFVNWAFDQRDFYLAHY